MMFLLLLSPQLQKKKLNLEPSLTELYLKRRMCENLSPDFTSLHTEVYLQCKALKGLLLFWKPCRRVFLPSLFGSCDVSFHLILEVYIQHEAVVVTSQPPEYIGLHTH
jgi:hypothetical protein